MEDRKTPSDPKDLQPDGGLYKNIQVSPRVLSIVIVLGCMVLAALMYLGTRQNGYSVVYNSKGGSDVSAQKYSYMESLELPEAPERQGYIFTGWYADENCTVPAEEGTQIEGELELYAGWKPEPE